MSTGHPKSKKSSNLYIVAAILLFIQTGIVYGAISMLGAGSFTQMLPFISAVFGFVYLAGAFFARTGTGVTGTTERHIGGGWYQRSAETANGITCGCMSGIGSLILTGYTTFTFAADYGPIIYAAGIPGFLGSILAMIAGIIALMGTASSSAPTSAPEPIEGARNCPFCGKVGLSPAATSCPGCGQPLQ